MASCNDLDFDSEQKDVAVKVLKDQGLQRVKADLENEIAVLKYEAHIIIGGADSFSDWENL